MSNTLNITWEKCNHGVEKRSFIPCAACKAERERFKSFLNKTKTEKATRIPILRGCPNKDGCFCTGACKEIVGYRDPFPGENK